MNFSCLASVLVFVLLCESAAIAAVFGKKKSSKPDPDEGKARRMYTGLPGGSREVPPLNRTRREMEQDKIAAEQRAAARAAQGLKPGEHFGSGVTYEQAFGKKGGSCFGGRKG